MPLMWKNYPNNRASKRYTYTLINPQASTGGFQMLFKRWAIDEDVCILWELRETGNHGNLHFERKKCHSIGSYHVS